MKSGEDYIGITVVSYCHDGKGNVALNLRSNNCRDEHGKWDLVGGELDFGESIIGAMKREIKQEYLTEVLDYEYLGFRELFRNHNGKPTHWLGLDYKVLVDSEKVSNGELHKFDAINWFTLDDLPSPLHSQFPKFLEKYYEKLKI